jgi:transcriptional regulator with XRE-family HTH domain
MNKAELENKKALGRTLFLSGMELTEIAERISVSRQTVSKWANTEGWKEARAAKSITRPELVNKLLLTIDKLITSVNESNDPSLIAGLGDRLAKLSSVIEKLDKKANVVDAIEVFMAFNRWIQDQACYDPEITPELIKAINKYQNLFLKDKMTSMTSTNEL